ncbi:Tubulin--tyrosine ligase-like protein 12 [Eumeta japonica]|uniref:Tubulin--tyrosine ligase-like protein 12 n=1 Tax=Eumeta variegata TaxID=151549 RepID=A0A4C1Y6J6_EUMVA|nr:Tubulin--tyrosine ligase-like protein 12 [Eumeta japonica]
MKIDYEDHPRGRYDPAWALIALSDIVPSDRNQIYLIDHVWTFKPNNIKRDLQVIPGLLERICNLMQTPKCDNREGSIEIICKDIWRYTQTYNFGGPDFSPEERVPMWYVLDEVGTAITHSDKPNFRTVPFYHAPEQLAYTLLFPIDVISEGDVITRDFVEGVGDSQQREAMLIPWKSISYTGDYTHVEADANYYLDGHIVETLPNLDRLHNSIRVKAIKLKVYSEYKYINDYLTCNDFEIVDNENDADILWYLNHFKMFKELSEDSPQKFVNQFPFEYVITTKDLLANVARTCTLSNKLLNDLETHPLWLPTTFNLKIELLKFAEYYMERNKLGLDNHWICKPYNLARGLDTYITQNLEFICRLAASGPKIAQKYLENPVLFERPNIGLVKFDIRYVILLTSVRPTKIYVYNNFFLRFSNKPFALNNFDDYEQHFTVMNYNEETPLYRLMCDEFKDAWAKQYENFDWNSVEKSIFSMFSELFKAATCKEPPFGIGESPQSRALYAADLMLTWRNTGDGETYNIQPKLLEINWMPDCQRACEYYPNFYNDIFSVMFFDKYVDTCVRIL